MSITRLQGPNIQFSKYMSKQTSMETEGKRKKDTLMCLVSTDGVILDMLP